MRTLLYIFLCFPILSVSQNLESTTNINIIKSWSQEPSGYSYPMNINVTAGIVLPNGFPVCILLHGNGGNGAGMMNEFMDILECHALVAPTGYLNSWNICAEDSDAPDLEMINDLVNILQAYSNINPNKIRILGFSNGAGLANNSVVENKNTAIDIVCAIVSCLNELQYHLGNFYKPSAYNIALNQGYTRSQLTSGITLGNPQITEYSYLSGDVLHNKGDAAHDANNTRLDYIKDYFLDCADVLNIDDYNLDKIKVYPNPTNSKITITGAYS